MVEFQMPNGRAYQFGPYDEARAMDIHAKATNVMYTPEGRPIVCPQTLTLPNGTLMTLYMEHFCAVALLPVKPEPRQPLAVLQGDAAKDAAKKIRFNA